MSGERALDRRGFMMVTGASTAAVMRAAGQASAALPGSAPTADRSAEPVGVGAAPATLARDFHELLSRMQVKGWGAVLAAAGLDLDRALAGDYELFRTLGTNLEAHFPQFGGRRAIQPGDPAMSLLYHVLAAPPIRLANSAPADAYPGIADLDLLENYIHARAPRPADYAELVPALFAFEYREAAKTPHRRHADFAFARAGVARVGDVEGHWDARRRSFVPDPDNKAASEGSAVLPARYGLFLARRLRRGAVDRIAYNSRDDKLDFLLPVRKLFSGSEDLGGAAIQFSQSHRDEKLHRLTGVVELPADDAMDLRRPPFLRTSASSALAGTERRLAGDDSRLVTLEALAGSVLVWPSPAPLVEQAFQNGKPCRFLVPPETRGIGSNRRYTSLRLVQQPTRLAQNFVYSDIIFGGGRYTTGFRAPQNVPAFVNIRHRIENGALTHLGETREEIGQISRGGYWASMFIDNLCDGCVTAEVIGGSGAEAEGLTRTVLPAFSMVAAPDFFPQFDPNDLSEFNGHFLEGGTETASGGRRPVNPGIRRPHEPEVAAFPVNLADTLTETLTAVVSAPASANGAPAPTSKRGYWSINSLPDTVSFVFAPGWDVTYSSSGDQPRVTFLASYGLGSPFPEDMKLCAVANGMWAGSSPDASRTFFPDLEAFPLLGRPATAVPLLDDELGYHPASPAVREYGGTARFGWDGEYGPFARADAESFGVDFADMLLSDYVTNARAGLFDLGRMRLLSATETSARMNALGRCIKALPGADRVRSTEMWLVSAEAVDRWQDGAAGLGVPEAFTLHDARGRVMAAPGISGGGWLFLFARSNGKPGASPNSKRRFQKCKAFYLCQVSESAVRYRKVTPDDLAGEGRGWRS